MAKRLSGSIGFQRKCREKHTKHIRNGKELDCTNSFDTRPVVAYIFKDCRKLQKKEANGSLQFSETAGLQQRNMDLQLSFCVKMLDFEFNPSMPIQPDSPHFRKSPGLKDKIHCVVYVIDTSKVKLLSDKMIEKFAVFRKKTNQLDVPQLVLLTKVDEACPLVAEDLKNVYQSYYINRMVQEVSTQLGVSLSAVIPVKNYYQELELDPQTDILLLNAVVQILRAAEGYFDDFYNPEEKSE